MRRSASTTRMASTKGGGCGDSVLPLVKQWYTLVKLDESGGIGHIVSDGELEELEMLILSGTQDASEDNDSVSVSLSGDGDSRDSGASEDTAADTEDTSGPLRSALTMYTKPGGPCDHCCAVGASRPGF